MGWLVKSISINLSITKFILKKNKIMKTTSFVWDSCLPTPQFTQLENLTAKGLTSKFHFFTVLLLLKIYFVPNIPKKAKLVTIPDLAGKAEALIPFLMSLISLWHIFCTDFFINDAIWLNKVCATLKTNQYLFSWGG